MERRASIKDFVLLTNKNRLILTGEFVNEFFVVEINHSSIRIRVHDLSSIFTEIFHEAQNFCNFTNFSKKKLLLY